MDGYIHQANPIDSNDMCLQITLKVTSEIFHFVWLDASELLLKRKNMKLNRCSELKTLKQQKYLIALIENSIERALEIPLNEVRKAKEKGTEEIIPFLSTHNPNNPNISNHKSNI